MKKYLVLSMSIILIVFSLPLGASADTIPDRRLRERVVDEANLLSASEERRLLDKVNEISERQNCDVVIVTVYDIGNKLLMSMLTISLTIMVMGKVKMQME